MRKKAGASGSCEESAMLEFLDQNKLRPETRDFYRRAVDILQEAAIPFLVGGAYALERYTGVVRHTKDFDVFLRRRDCSAVLELFAEKGYCSELTFPHWLGKVYFKNSFIDIIFSSGNGAVEVDDAWFSHSVPAEVLGKDVRLCPVEEMIWSKAFVMERERYDGADIAHLLHVRADTLNWPRLLERFGPHWRLLLSHLILFGYIYPSERSRIPADMMKALLLRLQKDHHTGGRVEEHVCHGTMLSREQYLMDINAWGYQDARLAPLGKMTMQAIAHWTAAIGMD
jgi:hypothetical protein